MSRVPRRLPSGMGRMKFMLFRKLLLLFAVIVALSAASANAQLGVYGTYSGQRFSGVTCPSFAGPCGYNDGDDRPYGGTFGAFYDTQRQFGPMRLGFDVRGDILTSNKRADSSAGGKGITRQYAALGGVRGTFHVPIRLIHPYAEVAGGIIRNNAIGAYTAVVSPNGGGTTASFDPNVYSVYPTVKGFAGVDVTVLPWLDLRAIELGAGAAFGSRTQLDSVSPLTTSTSSSRLTESIGVGVVFHIPR